MSVTTDSAIRILAAGGGLKVTAKDHTSDSLIRMAAAAANGGAHLTVIGAGVLMSDTMVRIGAAGRGHVTFDLT